MSCLKCLKYTMCMVNFIFFICGAAVFGIGVYLMASTRFSSLLPTLQAINIANTLFIIGIIITCVSFLGFLGALKENRCLLISFFILLFVVMLAELAAACILLMYEPQLGEFIDADLKSGLKRSIDNRNKNITVKDDWDTVQETFQCCGIHNFTEWRNNVPKSCIIPANGTSYWPLGCFEKLRITFEDNLMHTGIGVIIVCIIEVLGMCFSMTLFCHISRSGLGYK